MKNTNTGKASLFNLIEYVEFPHIKKRWEQDQPVCSRLPADYTDGPLISLAVQFQLFSMLFTLSIYFNWLTRCRTRPQALQIVQFGHQVLHQVVFSEAPLVEHLREQRKQLRNT